MIQGAILHDGYKTQVQQGVSESIGFILIFSIMIAGIGLVTLYGYPMLMQQQSGANEQVMEKNMIVLQNDVKSLVYKTVPYAESSLNVGGGTLTVYNASTTPVISTIDITSGSNHYGTPFMSGDLRYCRIVQAPRSPSRMVRW